MVHPQKLQQHSDSAGCSMVDASVAWLLSRTETLCVLVGAAWVIRCLYAATPASTAVVSLSEQPRRTAIGFALCGGQQVDRLCVDV